VYRQRKRDERARIIEELQKATDIAFLLEKNGVEPSESNVEEYQAGRESRIEKFLEWTYEEHLDEIEHLANI